jgi:hypothetical protein
MKTYKPRTLSAFGVISMEAERRFFQVRKPLPWVEPSINMLHLDAVKSFVFGSALASIGCATYLLEHSLRMAVWDPINSGSKRKKPPNKIFDETLKTLLSAKQYSENLRLVVPEDADLAWWQAITKAVRNNVNRIDFPAIFRIANELQFEHDDESWSVEDPHSWGMFWHRYGDKLASAFIVQVTDQVFKLIKNTQWKPVESFWISQKHEYDRFFQENWDFKSLQKSLNRA